MLTLFGAFGGAAACVGGAAVGYGTMLGATPRPCPHCDDDADVRRGGGGGGRRESGRKTSSSSSSSSSSAASPAVEEARRRAAYDALAEEFDEKLEWHELLTGIKAMRWWMMRQAKGEVRVRVHRFVFLLESLISPRRSRLTHRSFVARIRS